MHRDIDMAGQFASQVFDVDAGAAVHLRWKLPRQNTHSHERQARSRSSRLPMTTMPFGDTMYRLASAT